MTLDLAFVERAFENGFDCVSAVDQDASIRYWNGAMEKVSGIAPARALGARLTDVFPRLRNSPTEQLVLDALRGNHVIGSAPFFGVADRARARDYEWFATPLVNEGRVAGAALVARSEVARGAMREQMTEAEQRFRAMADSSPVLLWMAGRDSLCDFFNATWLEFSGRSLERELGVGWADGVHPEDFEHCMNTFMRAFSARSAFEMEYRLRRFDGEYRWLLDRGVPRFTPSGEFAGFIGSCVDITDRIHAEHETRELASELARANEYMEKLLYATSHDLREPMRMVATYVDLLEKHLGATLDRNGQKYLGYARDGAKRMRSLVEDLLNLAMIRQTEPRMENVDLGWLIRSLLQELGPIVEAKNAGVEFSALPEVRGDPSLLRSVFGNLLRNALKFHGERPPVIHIGAERLPDEDVISVADEGIGFEQEFAERVFQMFERLHPRDRYPGSGMGLALARDIVERHGGRIWAESEPGRGARFFVALPRER